MINLKIVLLIFITLSFIACSDNNAEKPKNEHIWKTQTDALQKTKDLAEQLEDEFKKKMEQMEKSQE